MKRFLSGRFLGGATALLALAAAGLLLGPRLVRAFTLSQMAISFDALSVPVDHTLHVNIVNQFGGNSVIVRAVCTPTTTAAGSRVVGAPIGLNPGQGSDEAFAFTAFSPPPGANRVPVLCEIFVSLGGRSLVPLEEWSGRLATSVEVIEDSTGRPTAILGARHVVVFPTTPGGDLKFCLDCN